MLTREFLVLTYSLLHWWCDKKIAVIQQIVHNLKNKSCKGISNFEPINDNEKIFEINTDRVGIINCLSLIGLIIGLCVLMQI